MDLHVGSKLHGFEVTRVRDVPGTQGQLVEMVFGKTGTPLAWMRSQEPNKLFSIAFTTLPEDSTGVFHILEHSVLCGSALYPVREPFVELLKSSMNTFLNAMTFPDKTLYPISSRNDQDYLNLASVYLDAVFEPRLLQNPNVFYQEGWHCERDGEGLAYNGVVFNEMKGALSDADTLANERFQQLLFPDTCYGYVSGGDPANIPDLTYERYCETYRRCYHPSNARVYLDGDVPLERTLELLEGYLGRYEQGERLAPQLQEPKAAEGTIHFEASEQDEGAARAQLVMGKILGNWQDKRRVLAAQVLCDAVAGSNEAPLKRAVLAAGLAQDVEMQVMDGVAQPWVSLRMRNVDDARAAELRELVARTARGLVEGGLDKDDLGASINQLEFQTRNLQEPQGLVRCIMALNSWLYGGDPLLYLDLEEDFHALRQMAEGDGFERLLRELLVEEDGLCMLHALPSAAYGAELRAQEAARLARLRDELGEGGMARLDQRLAGLRAWQETPDSPEALATLPVLSLDQIDEEPRELGCREEHVGGVTVLRHDADANGIAHVRAYFSLAGLSLEELTAASFMTALLGELGTARHDAATLQRLVKGQLGSLDFSVEAFGRKGRTAACMPYLVASCSVLEENLAFAWDLMREVLCETDFSNTEAIRQALLQSHTMAQQGAMAGGHMLGATCNLAHFSAQDAVSEATGGLTPIRWMGEFAEGFDARVGDFVALCQRVVDTCVNASGLVLGVTGGADVDVAPFVGMLPAGSGNKALEETVYRTALPRRLGIRIPAPVSYAGMGCNLATCGLGYDGTLRLAAKVASLDHLWAAVRVRGGAYGAGMQGGRSGDVFLYSYRDPSPATSLGEFRRTGAFLRDFAARGESLDKYVISTVAETEPLVGLRREGAMSDARWFAGVSHQDLVRERRELLQAGPEDLVRWGGAIDALGSEAAVCVVAGKEALAGCDDELLEVVDL